MNGWPLSLHPHQHFRRLPKQAAPSSMLTRHASCQRAFNVHVNICMSQQNEAMTNWHIVKKLPGRTQAGADWLAFWQQHGAARVAAGPAGPTAFPLVQP